MMELGMSVAAEHRQYVALCGKEWPFCSIGCRKFFSPCWVSISWRPISGSPKIACSTSGRKSVSCGRVTALVKEDSSDRQSDDGGILVNEFEFKPSFDEYLKALDSVRTGRNRKTPEQLGSSSISSKEMTATKSKRSGIYEKKKNFTEDDARLRRQELSGSSTEKNRSRRNDIEKGHGVGNKRTINGLEWNDEDSKEERGDGLYLERGRGRGRVCEEILDREGAEEAQRLTRLKVRMSKFNKGAEYRDVGSEFETRAAFRIYDDVGYNSPVSRVEMEQRIQKLAKGLNGADNDMPEWMFAKMMRSAKIRFSDHSITRIIQLLGNLGNWRRVLQVIEWLEKQERFKSYKLRHIYTAALDALGKARRPVEALNVFISMQQRISTYPDLVAYHSISVTLGQAGHLKELFDIINMMRSPPEKKFAEASTGEWDPRMEPDVYIYNAVLNACVKRKQCEGAFWVLDQLKIKGHNIPVATYGLVMEVLLACGKYDLVQEFFTEAQKLGTPNALTYRVLFNALWKDGKTEEAILAIEDMERCGIVGSAALYYDLARCLSSAGRCPEALKQIEKICKVASKPLVVAYTGLIQACLDSGNIQDGIFIFQQMERHCSPNLVVYNIMLKAYLENNMFEDAKKLFYKLLDEGSHINDKSEDGIRVRPDAYSFNTMIDACLAENRWEELEFVYKKMLNHGFHFNPKRHLHVIVEASRAGKGELLETTWNDLVQSNCSVPSDLIKEHLIALLGKDDPSGTTSVIVSRLASESLGSLSKKAFLKLFSENAQRFQREKLAQLAREVRVHMASTASHIPLLQNLVVACDEFLSTGW